MEEAPAAMALHVLHRTNDLLEKMGFGARTFQSLDELVASVSSMSVALYEQLFQFRLSSIVRVPTKPDDYAHNAQIVVDALSGALLDQAFAGDSVTGEALCAGDTECIEQVVEMFHQIYDILYGDHNAPPPEQAVTSRKQATKLSAAEKRSREKQSATRRGSHSTTVEANTSRSRNQSVRPARNAGANRSRQSTGRSSKRGKDEEMRASSRAAVNRSRSSSQPAAQTRKSCSEKRLPASTRAAAEEDDDAHALADESASEPEAAMLETRKYGRFVPLPDAQQVEADAASPDNVANEGADEGPFFAGLSSVSINSASAQSMHFLEDDSAFARHFASMPASDSPPPNQTRQQSGSASEVAQSRHVRAEQAEEHDALESRDSSPSLGKHQPDGHRSSPNQEQEDDDDDHGKQDAHRAADDSRGDASSLSPLRKKPAIRTQISPEVKAKSVAKDPSVAVYPLLPRHVVKRETQSSHRHFLRYKIILKEHLQDLRQREFCQRQHMARAYRLDEHQANVEKVAQYQIRAKRFEQELRLKRIALGAAERSQEEKQLRDAMQYMLQLEKEKLREEHRTTVAVLKQIQKDHEEKEQAMETFYSNQIQLVREQSQREAKERELIEKAHRMASGQLVRELRHDRQEQLAALLAEKRHLSEARRFRTGSRLERAIYEGNQPVARPHVDAFYAAALKARALRTQTSPSETAPTSHTVQSTRRIYRNEPLPMAQARTRASKHGRPVSGARHPLRARR